MLRPARTKSIASVMVTPSLFTSAVDSSRTQPPSPNCGIWNATSPSNGLNSIRTSCQIPSSSSRSGRLMARPNVDPSSHCSDCCKPPPALNQRISSPSRQLSRRKSGCCARSAIRRWVKWRNAWSSSDSASQLIHEISLS